jgi:hypothetical protein
MKVEAEHTAKPEVAKVIAKAHLKEFPPKKGKEDYYEGLEDMENALKHEGKNMEKKAFWNGFEKQALYENRGSELLSGALLSRLPLGTTGQMAMSSRPQEHSRGGEYAGRVLGAVGGSIPAYVLAHMGHLGTAGYQALRMTGAALGEGLVHNQMIKKYYDESGKLKPEYAEKG